MQAVVQFRALKKVVLLDAADSLALFCGPRFDSLALGNGLLGGVLGYAGGAPVEEAGAGGEEMAQWEGRLEEFLGWVRANGVLGFATPKAPLQVLWETPPPLCPRPLDDLTGHIPCACARERGPRPLSRCCGRAPPHSVLLSGLHTRSHVRSTWVTRYRALL